MAGGLKRGGGQGFRSFRHYARRVPLHHSVNYSEPTWSLDTDTDSSDSTHLTHTPHSTDDEDETTEEI